jgi:hypothetical protein
MVAEQAAAVGWAAPLEAAGHLVHFHRQLDHQVAKEAVPRRSKVRILAQAKKIRCIAVSLSEMHSKYEKYAKYDKYDRYVQYDKYDQYEPPISKCKTICQICKI